MRLRFVIVDMTFSVLFSHLICKTHVSATPWKRVKQVSTVKKS